MYPRVHLSWFTELTFRNNGVCFMGRVYGHFGGSPVSCTTFWTHSSWWCNLRRLIGFEVIQEGADEDLE